MGTAVQPGSDGEDRLADEGGQPYEGPERRLKGREDIEWEREHRRTRVITIAALSMGVLAVCLGIAAILSANASRTSAETLASSTNRRSVTIEALNAQAQQDLCVQKLLVQKSLLQIDVDQAVGVLALASKDPQQVAEGQRRFTELSQREEALRPKLENFERDCFDPYPIPQPPNNEDQPTTTQPK